MSTPQQNCEMALAKLLAAVRLRRPALLEQVEREHLQSCSVCRGSLLTLLLSLDPTLAIGNQPIDCEQCRAQLAAFIDGEQLDPAAAARAYPDVWWHLWTCWECAQVYEMTMAMLAGAALPEPGQASRTPEPAGQPIRLRRHMLRVAFPQHNTAYRTMRGSTADKMVIYDEVDDQGHAITVVVRERPDQGYQIVVKVVPAPQGRLVVTCGPLVLEAPFLADGTATLARVSSPVLVSPDAPDILVRIV
jgi:hypothetical protein